MQITIEQINYVMDKIDLTNIVKFLLNVTL